MLRINLLPIRQLKKRAKARNQIIAGLMIFLSVLAILALVGVMQTSRIATLDKDIAGKKREVKSFDKVVKELDELEKKRLDLNNKIRIINQLKTDSSLTVRVLDEVANLIDNNRMWLTSLNQNGATLILSGYALDNQTIAQFMDELKLKSPFITGVKLTNSSLDEVFGKDLKQFSLTCKVSSPAAPSEEQVKAEDQKGKA